MNKNIYSIYTILKFNSKTRIPPPPGYSARNLKNFEHRLNILG
nr:MAG TPA: hypothetical protein [Caudoviricetes sp.]